MPLVFGVQNRVLREPFPGSLENGSLGLASHARCLMLSNAGVKLHGFSLCFDTVFPYQALI